MFAVSETELGTTEAVWLRSRALRDAPSIALPSIGRVVVVSPHPDDETLAIGGTLNILARRGASIEVVAVTDGEGSHPRSRTHDRGSIRVRRMGEQSVALARLVDRPTRLSRLGIPDGKVGSERDLDLRLAELVDGACLVLAPYAHDGHPDHDATGSAAAHACARTGTPLLSYLVWAWHWASPEHPRVPWHRLRRVALDGAACRAKKRAIASFESQIRDLSDLPGDERILPPAVLARFERDFEVVLT